MILKRLLVSVALFGSLQTFAAITIESISGASAVDDSGTTFIVYGGIAGSDSVGSCGSKDGTRTCNNCDTGSNLACNKKRIYSNLDLTITLKSSSVSGTLKLLKGSTAELGATLGGTTTAVNQSVSITIKWSEICSNANGADASCGTNESSALPIQAGIDSDGDGDLDDSATISFRINTPTGSSIDVIDDCDGASESGFCGYTAFPGDEKVYLIDPETDDTSSFPSTSYGLAITGLRMYLSEESFAAANPRDADFIADLAVKAGSTPGKAFVDKRTITGLSNDTFYFTRVSVTDDAGNVSFITSDAAIDAYCGGGASAWTSATITDDQDRDCDLVAKPAVVVGLLTDDINCFVASAAYGAPWADKVKDLRNFRDLFLKTNSVGRAIVDIYYEHSPRLANWIQNSPNAQPFVRILLWPAWALATISLKWGLAWMLITVTTTFVLMFSLLRWRSVLYSRAFSQVQRLLRKA